MKAAKAATAIKTNRDPGNRTMTKARAAIGSKSSPNTTSQPKKVARWAKTCSLNQRVSGITSG